MTCSPEPSKIRAGTTVKWERTENQYADGFTGEYRLSGSVGPTIEIEATNTDGVFAVDEKPDVTELWAAGFYSWLFIVTDETDTFEVASGTIEIVALDSTGDALGDAKTYLEQAETELAARSSGKASSYSIKDRSLTRMSVTELLNAISYWRRRVTELEKALSQSKCKRSQRRITYGRFSQ